METQRPSFLLHPQQIKDRVLKTLGVTAISLTLLSGCSNDQQSTETAETAVYHTVRANSMLSQGEIGSALREVKMALTKQPEHLPAIKLAGDLFLTAGDSETALVYFQQALTSEPSNADNHFNMIEALIKQKQYHTARLQAEEAIKQVPEIKEDAILYALQGYIEMGTGNPAKAKTSLNQALEIDPENARALIGLAKISFQEGDIKKANDYTDMTRKAHPFALEGSLWAGQFSLLTEQYQNAENQFSEALLVLSKQDIMSADRYYALNGMVRSLVAQGKTEDALRYSEMIENSPQGQLIADYTSAVNLLKEGNIDAAEETFNTILSKIPGHTNSEMAVGAIKLRKGDLAAAEAHLLSAVESGQSVDRAHKLLALTQLRMNKPNEVIPLVSEALKKNEHDPELLSLLGISYLKLDNLKLAREHLQSALKKDPKHIASRLAMANIYEQEQAHAKAIALYKNIIQDNPNLATTYRSLFSSLLKTTDDNGQALNEFKQFAQQYIDHLAPNMILTMAHFERGNYPSALATAEDAKKRFPDSKEVDGALAAIHFSRARSLLNEPDLNTQKIKIVREAVSNAKQFAPEHLLIAGLEIQLFLKEKKTEQALQKAIDMQKAHPTHAFGYKAEGRIHQVSGQFEEAVKAYEQAWSIQPATQLGIQLFDLKQKMGMTGDALVTHLETWQSSEPDNPQASTALAMALQTIGSNDKAILLYEKVLEVNPKNALALNNLAWLRHEKGAPNAVSIAKRAYEAAPTNPSIIDTYGWLLYQSEQITAAVERLQEAHDLAPQQLEIMQHLKEALTANQQLEEASVIQAKIDAIQSNQG